MENGPKVRQFLKFQVERQTKNLFKKFLEILEDLQADGYNIPKDKHIQLRKRILDSGNETIRELNESIDQFCDVLNIRREEDEEQNK